MIFDGAVKALCKVLKAYTGAAGWPADPTRGQQVQPLRAMIQLGDILPSMVRIVKVLLQQRNDQLKIGLPWMEVHILSLATN